MLWLYIFEIGDEKGIQAYLCPFHAMQLSRLGYVLMPLGPGDKSRYRCMYYSSVAIILAEMQVHSSSGIVANSHN